MGGPFRVTKDALLVAIKAVPGASKTECAGIKDGRLRVRIAAAAEDGKANAALIAFFARITGCPRKDVRLAGGERSRLKTLAFPLERKGEVEQLLAGGASALNQVISNKNQVIGNK